MNGLLLAAIGVVIGLGLLGWTIMARRSRKRDPAEHEWIITTLESIKSEADRKRLHLHTTPKVDVDAAFIELRKLLMNYPEPLREKVHSIEQRWRDLNAQYAEFQAQSPGSTLQNSLIATRTSKLANEIGELTEELRQDLSS